MLGSYGLRNNPEPTNLPASSPLGCDTADVCSTWSPRICSSIKLYLPMPVTCSLTPPFPLWTDFCGVHENASLWALTTRSMKDPGPAKHSGIHHCVGQASALPIGCALPHLSTTGMFRQAQTWEAPGSSDCWMWLMDLPLILPKRF